MSKNKNFLSYIIFGILGALLLGFLGLNIYLMIKYGNAPREEVPNWVWWWFLG